MKIKKIIIGIVLILILVTIIVLDYVIKKDSLEVIDLETSLNDLNTSLNNSLEVIDLDTSLNSCENKIKKIIKAEEHKTIIPTNYTFIEIKQFTNSEDALNYLKDWEFTEKSAKLWVKEELIKLVEPSFVYTEEDYYTGRKIRKVMPRKIINHNDVVVALIKEKYSVYGTIITILAPAVCINGTITTENFIKKKESYTRCMKGWKC